MEEEIKNQLFAITATDKVDLATLEFDQRCIEAREDPTERNLGVAIRGADLAGQHFGIGITRGAKKAEAHQVGLIVVDRVDNDVVRCFGIGLIVHQAFMSSLF